MSRTEWILGILLGLLVMVVVVMALFFWLQPPVEFDGAGVLTAAPVQAGAADLAPTSTFQENTALFAYGLSQQSAASWQPDARLYNAQATWPQGSGRNTLLAGRASWTLTFYSAAAGQVLPVSVVNGAAQTGSPRGGGRALDPTSIAGWELDSDEIMRRFLANGGDDLLASSPVTTVTMALSMENEEDRAEWLVSMFVPASGQSLTMRFDADSGDVLEQVAAP